MSSEYSSRYSSLTQQIRKTIGQVAFSGSLSPIVHEVCVGFDQHRRRPFALHVATIQPNNARSERTKKMQIVTHNNDDLGSTHQVAHARFGFLLEGDVASAKNFVDEQDFGFNRGCYRKSQPHLHTGRITTHGDIQKVAEFGKSGDLGHPLLPESTAVRNSLSLGASSPRVLIVSGSNMSGKSTLLRAVGTNVVLALAGAPIRASKLELSPLALGATMTFGDSLQQGHSRFYSEILKIRDIVSLTNGSEPVLFLLDEILGGTNSHDRRIGAQAIVRSLVNAGAIGLVTTHDLALTELAADPGVHARNVHFEDHIEDGRMRFDYRMRDGVVERSNALELMRAVGLSV